jgi:hypothetical protein
MLARFGKRSFGRKEGHVKNILRSFIVLAGGLVLTLSALAPASASPDSSRVASACSWYWQDRDPGSSQVIHPVSGFSGIAMRTGPQGYCDLVTRVPWGHWVTLDCFVHDGQNVNGVTTWSHVRYSNGGPVYEGWISDYYLSGLGSGFNCA